MRSTHKFKYSEVDVIRQRALLEVYSAGKLCTLVQVQTKVNEV
jgi:hypothetical protein